MSTIQGTNAPSFDLEDFDHGRLDATEEESVQVSTACTVTATGFKVSNGAKGGSASFTFSSGSLTNAEMTEATFGSADGGVKEATLALRSSTDCYCCADLCCWLTRSSVSFI